MKDLSAYSPNREDIVAVRSLADSELYFVKLGYMNAEKDGWPSAVDSFRIALEIRPDSALVWLAWAQAQMYGLNDMEGSIASNLKAMQLDEKFSFLWVEIAHAQQMLGEDDFALQALDRAILNEHSEYAATAHAIRGSVELKRNHLDRAIWELRTATEISPDNLGFRVSYGEALCKTGRTLEAQAIWRTVLATDPAFPPALDAHCEADQP